MPKPSMTTRTIGRGRSATPRRSGHGRSASAGRGGGRDAGPADDAGHLVGLERRAADERAVDRRLGQELADVRGGDAAAVEDRDLGRGIGASRVARAAARIASAIAAASEPERVPAGPDRPDGLVGDDEAGGGEHGADRGRRAHPPSWRSTTSTGPTSFALGELLADAEDRAEAGLDRPGELAGRSARPSRRGRGGAREWPTITQFGEPDEHRRRDVAGVGAGELVVDVLGADPDVGPLGQRVADRGEAHERRADDPRDARDAGPARDRRGRARRRRPGSCSSSSCAAMMTGRIARIMPEGPTRPAASARRPRSAAGRRPRPAAAPAVRSARAPAGRPTDGSRAAPPARRASPRASRGAPRRPSGRRTAARPARRSRSSSSIAAIWRPAAPTARWRFADSALRTRLSSPRRARETWRASSSRSAAVGADPAQERARPCRRSSR